MKRVAGALGLTVAPACLARPATLGVAEAPAVMGLARLLPAGVEVESTAIDSPECTLLVEEAAAVAQAVPKRRAEFCTVRDCARRALARLGQPPVPIVPGPDRAPQWPVGIVGSLTHCDGYRAAAVASTAVLASLGIDAEPNQPLPVGVAPLVTIAGEVDMLARLARATPTICWDRLLFSAKESIFKAWYPLARRWLDFGQCELAIDADRGVFIGRLLVPGPVYAGHQIGQFAGRWAVTGGHVLTAVHVCAIRGGAVADPAAADAAVADPTAADPTAADPAAAEPAAAGLSQDPLASR